MNEALLLALALLTGVLLGGIFFGGLWWTVRKCVSSDRPAFWVLGSALLRTGMVLAGFFVIAQGRWERLVACLGGFIIARMMARIIVTRLARADKGGKPCALLPIS